MAVQAVIFDLGHTVWDIPRQEQSWGIAVERMYKRMLRDKEGMNIASAEALGRAIGLTTTDWETRYTQGEPLSQPPSSYFIEEALRSVNLAVSDELVTELTDLLFGSEHSVRTVEPDTANTLETLHEGGLALGCVTNTLLLEKAILDLLELLELREHFSSVVVSSEAGYRKPHPSLFQRALDELKTAAPEAVFVGDSFRNDIVGAKDLGMLAVLTTQYRHEAPGNASLAPDAVIARMSELPEVLERIGARH